MIWACDQRLPRGNIDGKKHPRKAWMGKIGLGPQGSKEKELIAKSTKICLAVFVFKADVDKYWQKHTTNLKYIWETL